MTRRLLALVAGLALSAAAPVAGLAAGPTPPPPPPPGSTAVLVHATVSSNSPAAVVLTVREAATSAPLTDVKTPVPGLAGQDVTASWCPFSTVWDGARQAGFDFLKAAMPVEGLITTTGEPTPTAAYCVVRLKTAGTTTPAPPPGPGTTPGAEPPHPPAGDRPGSDFDRGFFARNWRMTGDVLGTDTVDGKDVIDLDVQRLVGGPKRFRDEGREVAALDALVIVGPKVVITTTDGTRIGFGDVQVDDALQVVGRVLRPAAWLDDSSGQPTPTVFAKRIRVTSR